MLPTRDPNTLLLASQDAKVRKGSTLLLRTCSSGGASMMDGEEDTRTVEDCDMDAATEAADHLYNNGEGQWGTSEEAFIELLCAWRVH